MQQRVMENLLQSTFLGLDRPELISLMDSLGEPAYRASQILDAVYRQRVDSIEQISTLPQPVRQRLAEQEASIGFPKIEKQLVSQDGTVRYLMQFADGQSVETVWMPEGDGGEAGDGSEAGDLAERFAEVQDQQEAQDQKSNRRPRQGQNHGRSTICISSQVGCAVDCQFCLTALLGVKRNLTAGEIVGQVGCVLRDRRVSPPQDRVNLVFMGMGAPFLHYDNCMKALRLLVEGFGMPASRMTLSTAGVVPRIHDFGREPIRPKLAISLNAADDAQRAELMPINRKWDLEKLLDAARTFPLRPRERLTFEYVLLNDV